MAAPRASRLISTPVPDRETCSDSAAPLGLTYTGDTTMNGPWTALGTPAISIPMPLAAGLPLGLQLTAERGQDVRLLRTAVRLQKMLSA